METFKFLITYIAYLRGLYIMKSNRKIRKKLPKPLQNRRL